LVAFVPLEMSKGSPSVFSAMTNMLRRLWPGIGSAFGSATPGFCLICYCLIISRYLRLAAKVKVPESSLHSWRRAMADGEIVLFVFGLIGVLIVGTLGWRYIPSPVGLPVLADLLVYLAVGLWISLISCVWVLFFVRRQSAKQT
jgi:hypothetical protein